MTTISSLIQRPSVLNSIKLRCTDFYTNCLIKFLIFYGTSDVSTDHLLVADLSVHHKHGQTRTGSLCKFSNKIFGLFWRIMVEFEPNQTDSWSKVTDIILGPVRTWLEFILDVLGPPTWTEKSHQTALYRWVDQILIWDKPGRSGGIFQAIRDVRGRLI